MNQCIAAHTNPTQPAPGTLVGFINAYDMENGNVRISIRAECDAESAEVVSLQLSDADWDDFITTAMNYRLKKRNNA